MKEEQVIFREVGKPYCALHREGISVTRSVRKITIRRKGIEIEDLNSAEREEIRVQTMHTTLVKREAEFVNEGKAKIYEVTIYIEFRDRKECVKDLTIDADLRLEVSPATLSEMEIDAEFLRMMHVVVDHAEIDPEGTRFHNFFRNE